MSDLEKLHFKIGLAGTHWNKRPIYSAIVNDALILTREVETPSGEVFFIEFDANVVEGSATLKIRLENKDWTDTIQNEDKTEILKDMMLHIKSVEIDEIDIGNMIYTKTLFVGDDPERPELDMCIDMGWNGTWTLTFESPFYLWLLENI
ncbi:hypothetical protein UFOVP112_453 [uncultured Caudovirales phage]|uniref:Uncharacterized protein n=1 Tax=uncultured Caudovirales phage TaxID=2100421 RepID=A0A6J5L5W0_9CAUD|nr:hypothetical protein UFOVP112_453 [uncultured Caudovirales phage]